MRKTWNLIPKILSCVKTIESRWYKTKYPPWNKIQKNEKIYFKDSGSPVSIKAEVEKVLQFENLIAEKVKEILNNYGQNDGIEDNELEKYFDLFKNKKYCLLIFLRNPEKINPFNISKKGFGLMASWIYIEDINKIKFQ
ncbi:hypothetical protein J4449_03685 [Candidatus Woesearchaeota archaeon]|nr:hypothetical protein [Candidatus Woesearchaeota archaeon]